MNPRLFLNDLVAYSLQIGLLVGLAAFVPTLLRLRHPAARLVYWRILLAACLLLPLVQPWRQAVTTAAVQVTTGTFVVHQGAPAPTRSLPPRSEIALILVAAGTAIRLAWLAAGFWRLRLYRRRALPLEPAGTWGIEADLRLSSDVTSPVTFGWRRPVVLLPAQFPALDQHAQNAILCHEILHVRRADWLFTLGEELVRAVFWFHPAVWWLLAEIGLAREQEVDRLAIDITREREHYLDALLAVAGARPQADLAPAPLFLRKRHLKQRVVLILKEARMSKTRLISALAASLAILVAVCWLVTGTFPLMAAPQVVTDSAGITVEMNGASLIHRTPVTYPTAALRARVQGTVAVEAKLDGSGNVTDARVLSGPDELRRAALESVLQWHFAHDAGATRTVSITFALPDENAAQGPPTGVLGGIISVAPGTVGPPQGVTVRQAIVVPRQTDAPSAPHVYKGAVVRGLSEEATRELLAALPIREGEELTPEALTRVRQAVTAFDEHLSVQTAGIADASNGEQLVITAPQAAPERIKVGGNVQNAMVLRKVAPAYPAAAKAAGTSGVVHLTVIIGKDGTVVELRSTGGPAELIGPAMDAVKQWVYRPTMLNGNPVQVETTVDVNFTLMQ